MPIQVPRLKNIQGSAQTNKGVRINARAQDNTALIGAQTRSASNLVNQASAAHDRYETRKVDQVTSQLEQEYTPWLNDRLTQLKSFQGDPTKPYADFDEEDDNKLASMLENHKDLSENVKQRIQANLGAIQSKNRIAVHKQRGYQKEVYKNNLFESNLSLKRKGLPTTAGYIQKGDESSFVPFDMGVSEIKTAISKRALENGTAELLPDDAKTGFNHFFQDSNGKLVKVKLSPIAQKRAAKELSEGISDSIEVLLDNGQSDEAGELLAKYKNNIDPVNEAKLNKKFKTTAIKTNARNVVNSIQDLPEEKQIARIEKIKDVDEKIEALKLQSTLQNRLSSLKKAKEDKNYELAHSRVEELRNNGQLYGLSDIENDPKVKRTWDNMSEKQRQALREQVESPKRSDPKVMANVNDMILTGKLGNMSAAKFEEMLVGLDEADKDRSRNRFISRKKDKSTRSSTAYNDADKILTRRLYASGLIRKDKYGKGPTKNDFPKYSEAKDGLIDYLDSKDITNASTRKEISDYVDEYITEQKKGELFGNTGGGFFASLFGDDEEKPVKPTKVALREFKKDPLKGLDDGQIFKLQREYKKLMKLKSSPTTSDVGFLNYVEGKNNG